MPMIIQCSNTFCDGLADKPGGLCHKCEEQAKKQQDSQWLYKGFRKNLDNERKHAKKPEAK